MFKETISWNLDSMIVKRQTQNSRTFHRHRKSIYMITKMEKVEYIQNRYFTRPYKIAVCLLGFCHLCLFIVTFFTQITYAINLNMHNTKCHERYTYNNSYNKKNSIWQLNDDHNARMNGCHLKVPFCKTMFTPKCNCVKLNMENIDLPSLSQLVPDEMHALKQINIINCNLKQLPKRMEKLTSMFTFDVSYNNLSEFDIDILKWGYLTDLNLKFNKISQHNEKAIWNHPYLQKIWVNNNIGFRLSGKNKVHLPYLNYLNIANNSMLLPKKFGLTEFPMLKHLFAGGNDLKDGLPQNFETLNNQLEELDISRCHIKKLGASYFSKFSETLKLLDARNNNISDVDASFQSVIYNNEDIPNSNKNTTLLLFAGNPVCNIDDSWIKKYKYACDQLCSKYCHFYTKSGLEIYQPSITGFEKRCHEGCFSHSCNNDGGRCNQNTFQTPCHSCINSK